MDMEINALLILNFPAPCGRGLRGGGGLRFHPPCVPPVEGGNYIRFEAVKAELSQLFLTKAT
jgi:hypothetical protein